MILPVKGCDLLLSFGPIVWNFSSLVMQFDYRGNPCTLQVNLVMFSSFLKGYLLKGCRTIEFPFKISLRWSESGHISTSLSRRLKLKS
ncbi:hypothetical protein EPI10_005945 [Gossypium australe]|uniref:Uncharacterized protein n=1 Tax=Gossypium australe TaxID=47621 RepID=A0A5B6WR98_9ROSI|nr:hypothetical protein EPI10_005945 [Gossypium australe]